MLFSTAAVPFYIPPSAQVLQFLYNLVNTCYLLVCLFDTSQLNGYNHLIFNKCYIHTTQNSAGGRHRMGSKHIKSYSTLLVIKGKQIKSQ